MDNNGYISALGNPSKLALYIELEKNIKDEAAAREGYYKLLLNFGYLLTQQEVTEIENIIAEELKHSVILNDMIYRRNMIAPEQ